MKLLRCEDDEPSADDDDDDDATYEYIRLEAAYDAIFATTNSFCPVRGAPSSRGASATSDGEAPPSGYATLDGPSREVRE